ncbi:hypothetical protein QM826_04945 [Streptococcus parasanguinis]|jgi:hypothetical protein|uniref:hypothetical protein n=1 Tax=Streptococcus parasanguinis TaxID=1318 RepID=UPI0020626B71|nr:MAG TPA: hypothetical protein [Caudoviricetes sp.]
MYNDILAGLTIAGTFFTAGYIGAVWDFKKAQRKKLTEQKIKAVTDALDEGVLEVKLEGVNEYLTKLAEARKHSYSDNSWQ